MTNSKRKKCIFACFVVVVSIICSCAIIGFTKNKTIAQADYKMYDEDTLVKASDVIIEGTVLDTKSKKIKYLFSPEKTYKDDEDKQLYLVSSVKIDKVIKGNLKVADIIEVKQYGDGKDIIDKDIANGSGYFSKKSTYVLFLKDFLNFKVPYSAMNPIQAVFKIESNGNVNRHKSNKLFTNNKMSTVAKSNETEECQLISQIHDVVNSSK